MNQNARLLAALKKGPVNPLSAWVDLGIYRLAARVADLRSAGHPVTKTMVQVQNQYGEPCLVAEYTLEQAESLKKAG